MPTLTKEQVSALIRRTDDETVERFTNMIPEQLREHLAGPLRPLFKGLIEHERQRCVEVLKIGANYHRHRVNEISSAQIAAMALGQPVDNLALERVGAEASVAAVQKAAQAVSVPPGSCVKCGGAKAVPAALVMSGGQRPLVPCPVCVPVSASVGVAAAATAADITASPGGG